MILANIKEIVRCPLCESDQLAMATDSWECQHCGKGFKVRNGQPDFRLPQQKVCSVNFTIGDSLKMDQTRFDELCYNENCELDLDKIDVPHHLSRELISHFPKATSDKSVVLDLGCGSGLHREICGYAGYQYVGLDYGHPKAPILGDAHSLPFRDKSFDFVLSIAVLEHIQYPFLMMKEVYRVLKPGGKFIGTVAFLEPYHTESYFHHSHLGTFNVLNFAGFEIHHISPSSSWSVLVAQSKVLFPRVPRIVSRSIVLPLQYFHRMYWSMLRLMFRKNNYSDNYRSIITTGAFTYIASKTKP